MKKVEVSKRKKKNYARQWPFKQKPEGNGVTSYRDTKGITQSKMRKVSAKQYPSVEHACVVKLNE